MKAARVGLFLVAVGALGGFAWWSLNSAERDLGPEGPPVNQPREPSESDEAAVGTDAPAALASSSLEGLGEELQGLRQQEGSDADRRRVEVLREIGQREGEDATALLREALGKGGTQERLAAINVLWARGERAYLEDLATRSDDRVLRAKVEALREKRSSR